jgi:hypothetical protein
VTGHGTAAALAVNRILTLDQDFRIYRWSGSRRFDLLVSA